MLKTFLTKIKTWLSDHYHILFKSAAVNHLRIQELMKNPDGTYQLTVKFGSYSELKNYQKKLRRLTVSLSSAVAMVVVAFIVAPYIMNPNRSSASTFLWTQSSWSTMNGTTQNYPTNNTNTVDYSSKSGVDVSTGDITLPTPVPASTGDVAYTGGTGFYRSDGSGTYSASGAVLALKKSANATCGNNTECKSDVCSTTCKGLIGDACSADAGCASGWCSASVCTDPWISGPCAGIAVYKNTNASFAQWQTSTTVNCVSPQCSSGVLVASNAVDFSVYPARNACKTLGGRLPTTQELACIYTNVGSYNANGAFGTGGYWTANESAINTANTIFFSNGSNNPYTKTNNTMSVRCVK